jgi:glutathione S-transferase
MPTDSPALTLHMHPLASYCWKVLIALREGGTPFEQAVPPGPSRTDPRLTALWPFGKIPVLEDTARGEVVAETSIIIDYLQQHYPGPARLIPEEPGAAREARLWDRFADLYLSNNMQKIVGDRLRPEDVRDAHGVEEARGQFDIAYALFERRMTGRQWAGGEAFSMADCATFPPLFFLQAIHPYRANHPAIAAYVERMLARPSVRETVRAAQPFFQYFPFGDALEPRFLNGDF